MNNVHTTPLLLLNPSFIFLYFFCLSGFSPLLFFFFFFSSSLLSAPYPSFDLFCKASVFVGQKQTGAGAWYSKH